MASAPHGPILVYPETDEKRRMTLSSMALNRLREEIVRGDLTPSAKLRIKDLTQRYGIGPSPLREALSRLVGDGLVTVEEQKGFRVAPISLEHMLDVAEARQVVEVDAFRLAMERGDDEWEARIVGAFHRLKRATAQRLSDMEGRSDEWEPFHKAFHGALIAACGIHSLTEFCQSLYDQATRYRYLLFKHDIPGDRLVDEHQQLMDAALERDIERGCDLLGRHMRLTVDVILSTWGGKNGAENAVLAAMEGQSGKQP